MLALSPSLANAAALRIGSFPCRFATFGFDGFARFWGGNPVPLPFLGLLAPMVNINREKEDDAERDANTHGDQDSVRFELSTCPRRLHFLLESFRRRQQYKISAHDLSRLNWFLFCLGRTIDVQPLHPVAKRVAADFQVFSRTADAEAALFQCLHDQLPFKVRHGVVQ